eukprot:g31676.t1
MGQEEHYPRSNGMDFGLVQNGRKKGRDDLRQECPVFTKTFKSMEKPTAEELTKQLRHITEWLPLLVAIPSDVDLDLVDVEDENIKAVSISNGVNTMRRFEADE